MASTFIAEFSPKASVEYSASFFSACVEQQLILPSRHFLTRETSLLKIKIAEVSGKSLSLSPCRYPWIAPWPTTNNKQGNLLLTNCDINNLKQRLVSIFLNCVKHR
jgi:hypothetical protein